MNIRAKRNPSVLNLKSPHCILILTKSSQKTATKESVYPISVALERGLNASVQANIQPASDRVTDIGYTLSLVASVLNIFQKKMQNTLL